MVPGEYLFDGDDVELNAGRATVTLEVNNTATGPSRSARTTTSSRSTRRWCSTARRPTACGSTCPPARRSGSSPARSRPCGWSPGRRPRGLRLLRAGRRQARRPGRRASGDGADAARQGFGDPGQAADAGEDRGDA